MLIHVTGMQVPLLVHVLTLKSDSADEVCMSRYGIDTFSLSDIPYPGSVVFTSCRYMITEKHDSACTFIWTEAQQNPVEQIRRVFEDKGGYLRITEGQVLLFLHKSIYCGYSLKSPHWGDSNEHPQHMFLCWTTDSYPLIIIKYPLKILL